MNCAILTGSHVNLCKILTRRALAAAGAEQAEASGREQARESALQAAFTHCTRAVELDEANFHARFYAGGQRTAAGDYAGAVVHYAAAVVLDSTSAEAHFQLSQALLQSAFAEGPSAKKGNPSVEATVRGSARELSRAAEQLCERCVRGAGGQAAEQCECLSATPRGRALSLLLAADGESGIASRDDVMAAVEAQLAHMETLAAADQDREL